MLQGCKYSVIVFVIYKGYNSISDNYKGGVFVKLFKSKKKIAIIGTMLTTMLWEP